MRDHYVEGMTNVGGEVFLIHQSFVSVWLLKIPVYVNIHVCHYNIQCVYVHTYKVSLVAEHKKLYTVGIVIAQMSCSGLGSVSILATLWLSQLAIFFVPETCITYLLHSCRFPICSLSTVVWRGGDCGPPPFPYFVMLIGHESHLAEDSWSRHTVWNQHDRIWKGGAQSPLPLQTAIATEQFRNVQDSERYAIHFSGTKTY